MAPAQVPSRGRPDAANSRSGSHRPSRSIPFVMVVTLAPGQDRARPAAAISCARSTRTRSRPDALERTDVRRDVALDREDADAGRAQPAAATSRGSASRSCSASVVDLDAVHGLAESARGVQHLLGLLPVGGGVHDGPGARRGVVALEDARADEHGLGAEGHAQRRVGRRGDAAGGEVRHRQLPVLGHAAHQVDRARRSSLARAGSSSGRSACRARGCRRSPGAGGAPPRRCCRCRPRPWCGSWPRPRRCAAAPRRGCARRTRRAIGSRACRRGARRRPASAPRSRR